LIKRKQAQPKTFKIGNQVKENISIKYSFNHPISQEAQHFFNIFAFNCGIFLFCFGNHAVFSNF
jgi:hypothetical protein